MFWIKYTFLRIFAPNRLVTLEYRLFRMLNNERRAEGLHTLFYQKDLRKVGRKHSMDMAQQDYFAHENLEGRSPKQRFESARISEVVSGENLAKVRGYPNCVLTAHVGLMNSPGHKANILSKHYNCVGIGAAVSDDETFYFTQNFSHRILLLSKAPDSLRFRSRFKLKGRVLEDDVSSIAVIVRDHYDRIVTEKPVESSESGKFVIPLTLKRRGKYEISIFAGHQSLRLSNRFSIHKKGWLW